MTLLDQVRATIAHHQLFERGDTIVVGVSGGPDSLALLHCLCALCGELQITLHVAHLNHQLRGAESDADAEFVASLAREWELPATIESRDVAEPLDERLSGDLDAHGAGDGNLARLVLGEHREDKRDEGREQYEQEEVTPHHFRPSATS